MNRSNLSRRGSRPVRSASLAHNGFFALCTNGAAGFQARAAKRMFCRAFRSAFRSFAQERKSPNVIADTFALQRRVKHLMRLIERFQNEGKCLRRGSRESQSEYGGSMRSLLFTTMAAGIAMTLALASTAAWATNHAVQVGGGIGLAFSPQFLTINAGDTVTFTNAGGQHNVSSDPGAVTSFHCSTACGTSPTGDPNSALWSQTITFPNPGTAGYHCELHGAPGQGMFGTITVGPTPVELQSFEVD